MLLEVLPGPFDVEVNVTGFERWLGMMESGDHTGLWDLLHPDCVFWSPVVHTPQQGRPISHAYLSAAGEVFNDNFRYTRRIIEGNQGVFEFHCGMDDIDVNGVDIITLENAHIVEFKVMVRPLKAVHKVHEKMMAMLEAMQAGKAAAP